MFWPNMVFSHVPILYFMIMCFFVQVYLLKDWSEFKIYLAQYHFWYLGFADVFREKYYYQWGQWLPLVRCYVWI